MLPAVLLIVFNAVQRSTAYDFFKSYESGRKSLSSVQFGPYTLAWDPADPYIQIHHNDEPHRYLFRTLPSWPFVTIGNKVRVHDWLPNINISLFLFRLCN